MGEQVSYGSSEGDKSRYESGHWFVFFLQNSEGHPFLYLDCGLN